MKDKAFIDTNVLIYAYSFSDILKREKAIVELKNYDCIISIQVLNEFCNICIKKYKLSFQEIQDMLNDILQLYELSYIKEETIYQAIILQSRYKFSYYDSLIISSALENGCKYLLSEDLSDKQEIEELFIKNVFVI
jgi:predicted nucleic acid-binding protein